MNFWLRDHVACARYFNPIELLVMKFLVRLRRLLRHPVLPILPAAQSEVKPRPQVLGLCVICICMD
jgi:hypothetical protein